MPKLTIDRRNHYRAILTDTLPYEVPLFFTNEPLYRVVSTQSVRESLPNYIANLLFNSSATQPFFYRTRKTGGGKRNLAIPHPAAQIGFADFYKDFDSYIENVCGRSSYSLRHPTRVGSHFYQSQYASKSDDASQVDEDPASFSAQRTWASSYFSYRHFTHIHKFFGSQDFLSLEQQYSWMLKLDVARCFESIYTHSITWALRGKDFGKENKKRKFFESCFDTRMRNANWGETNGILIGPEVSRIFAECIMQSIDVELSMSLGSDRNKITVRRYVDDYFLFSNSTEVLSRAESTIESIASKFNLHFNQSKRSLVPRPFVAPFAVARQRVRILLEEILRLMKQQLTEENPPEPFSARSSDKTIAEIRRIASQYSADYSTLASPSLAVLARGLAKLNSRTRGALPDFAAARVDHINSTLLRISAFLYVMDIRAATSDNVARVFLECSRLNRKAGRGRIAFEGLIQDVLRLALAQAKLTDTTGPEVINILVAADAVCSNVRTITDDSLRSALGLDADWVAGCSKLNYFDLVAVLYLAGRRRSLSDARKAASDEVESRVRKCGRKLGDHAEETMLFLDYLSCAYVPESRRLTLLTDVALAHGVTLTKAVAKAHLDVTSKSVRFVAWDGARNFKGMLARRQLQPAYDS